ncbi:hypothetical protein RLOC_00011861 [Lonchura striata]|uniref:Uncharacterized protein n=1 Tax=Lonchura striata TaxID=40157 RepID=A0A218V3J8_9PASE|nr:hypothetical protein RLOC_00011861 [Lonchura striata domestica]
MDEKALPEIFVVYLELSNRCCTWKKGNLQRGWEANPEVGLSSVVQGRGILHFLTAEGTKVMLRGV